MSFPGAAGWLPTITRPGTSQLHATVGPAIAPIALPTSSGLGSAQRSSAASSPALEDSAWRRSSATGARRRTGRRAGRRPQRAAVIFGGGSTCRAAALAPRGSKHQPTLRL